MGRWAQPLRSRDQIVLFAPTLEDAITGDHSVRLFDELISQLDFKDWEQRYCLTDGQPPIHPRVMASVILYGLSLGIRPSRKLEEACGNRIDFMWLTQGRVIDHSTLAGFRVKFETELKELFRQIGRVAIGMGMANLNQVALDGTVKRASNSRSAVATRATLEQKLAALDEQVEQLMVQAAAADRQDQELFGESSPMKLPGALKDVQSRQKQLARALAKARQIEARQKEHGRKSGPNGPAVATTDVDSTLMKNKTGGFAPNYLVVLATEGQNGLIMDYQVPAHGDEPSSVMPAMQNLKEAYTPADVAEPPRPQPQSQEPQLSQADQPDQASAPASWEVKQLLADTGFNSGRNLEQLKASGIEPLMPARTQSSVQPTPQEPASGQGDGPKDGGACQQQSSQLMKLDKSAFIYEEQADAYRCPAGRSLPLLRIGSDQEQWGKASYREYQSKDCAGCSLAGRCLSSKGSRRRIRRDEFEPLREELALRMKTPQARARYRRRAHLAETPFAVINTSMNVRQLLLRGINKATTELGWICSAYNLKKLASLLANQRRQATTVLG